MRDNTAAERFRELIDKVPPLERQGLLESTLDVAVEKDLSHLATYMPTTAVAVLRTIYPEGGTWRKKVGKHAVVRRGLDPHESAILAYDRLEAELATDGTAMAIARPRAVPGLIVGWLIGRGSSLVLCYTQENLRRCGVQRLLMREVFHGGRPKYHVYEPRGSAEFLRRLGTERAR